MKKITKIFTVALVAASVLAPLSAKAKKGVKIAIPNDTTNEARALLTRNRELRRLRHRPGRLRENDCFQRE